MIIDKSEVNGFTVLIEHDEDPDSPRNWTVGADLTDAELAAAIERGLASGQMIGVEKWMASNRDASTTCGNCGCETGTEPVHSPYPHEPGRLYDCPACEASCHCTEGYTRCVFEGEHNGLAETVEPVGTPTGRLPYPEGSVHEPPMQGIGPSYGPNADGNPYAQYTPESRVWAKAQENGKAAASWVFDGNTAPKAYRRVLKGIRDGDPEIMDGLHPGSLWGEYADRDILADAKWVPHDGTDLRTELIDQYARETVQAFWHEVEATCLRQLPHQQQLNYVQLGQRFITCSCGHSESGGAHDGIAERNMAHHIETARKV